MAGWGRHLQKKQLRTELGERLKVKIILLTPTPKLREEQGKIPGN